MTIIYGLQGWFSNGGINTRRQLDINIPAMAVEVTQDVVVKAGITDKVGHEEGGIEGIVGCPGSQAWCGGANWDERVSCDRDHHESRGICWAETDSRREGVGTMDFGLSLLCPLGTQQYTGGGPMIELIAGGRGRLSLVYAL